MHSNSQRIIKNPVPLSDDYIPNGAPYRDKQLKDIVLGVRSVAEQPSYRGSGPHLFILGLSGTGKTLTVKKALEYLKKRAEVCHVKLLTSYVNCTGASRRYPLLKAILTDFGVKVKDGWPDYKLMEMYKKVEGNKLVILDEADLYLSTGEETMPYILSRTPGMSIILVSNKLQLDSMIKNPGAASSLMGRHIRFMPYNADEIYGIVAERAKMAFAEKPSEDVLRLIAGLVSSRNGDARHAIKLLAESADMAEDQGTLHITPDMVKGADIELHRQEIVQDLRAQSSHTRILFKAVVDCLPDQNWSAICGKYKEMAGDDAFSDRRALDLLKGLDRTGLVFYVPRQKKGSTVKLQVDPVLARRVVEEMDGET